VRLELTASRVAERSQKSGFRIKQAGVTMSEFQENIAQADDPRLKLVDRAMKLKFVFK
jgi:hypothetical protein